MNDVSLIRLYLLRALYLLIVAGLAMAVWPGVIGHALQHDKPWELMTGVVQCMLAAFSLLCLLGLRYPLQMLPVLLWELVWKTLWLLIVAVPLWRVGQMDESTWEIASAVLFVVILPFAIPWPYVFAHYVKKPGSRWRAQA